MPPGLSGGNSGAAPPPPPGATADEFVDGRIRRVALAPQRVGAVQGGGPEQERACSVGMCATKCGAGTVSPVFTLFHKYICKYTSRGGAMAGSHPGSRRLALSVSRSQ